MELSTKERLIQVGLAMLLEQGYNHLGIQDVLDAAKAPKGSFYHHFDSKEDFALAVVERYMTGVHQALDACLLDERKPPLQRIRNFFETVRDSYRAEGYLGCLLGGLGQELSGVNEVFREKIEHCIRAISDSLERCLALAIERGDLDRRADAHHLAGLLVNCWEGAALRSRLLRDPAPLGAMLDFYFASVVGAPPVRTSSRRQRSSRRH